MFFNKSKKTGYQLATLVLDLANGNEAKQFISRNAFKPEEALRFHWGLGIVNMVTATWLVNITAGDRDNAKSILEPMLAAYQDLMETTGTTSLRIGDLIVHEEEKRLVRYNIVSSTQSGSVHNIDNIGTDIRSLTSMVYDWRQAQYYEDLTIGSKEIMSSDEVTLGPMFHVAKRFSTHLTGDENDSTLVVQLSLLLGDFSIVLMTYCRGEIGK